MSAAGRALALRGGVARSRLRTAPRRVAHHAAEVMTAGFGVSPLARSAPGRVVTFAGVQGGAGVSTMTLLMCGAVTRASDRPALAVDLAPGTRGGLGGHAGAWSQTSAERTAELVIEGGRLARPYAQTDGGVHVISDEPEAPIVADRAACELLAEVAAAVRRDAADHELAAIARIAAADAAIDEFAGIDSLARRAALRKLVRAAGGPHSLVALDLGLADVELLTAQAPFGHLHVWVVCARRDDLEVVRRRLSSHAVVAMRELVLVWQPDGERIGSRGLRGLGEARGCQVARLARFDHAGSWAERERACRSGLEALCRQLD